MTDDFVNTYKRKFSALWRFARFSKQDKSLCVVHINSERKLLIILRFFASHFSLLRCWNSSGDNQRRRLAYDYIWCSPVHRSVRPTPVRARKFIVWLAVSWIPTSPTASIISSEHAGTSIEVSRVRFHVNESFFSIKRISCREMMLNRERQASNARASPPPTYRSNTGTLLRLVQNIKRNMSRALRMPKPTHSICCAQLSLKISITNSILFPVTCV